MLIKKEKTSKTGFYPLTHDYNFYFRYIIIKLYIQKFYLSKKLECYININYPTYDTSDISLIPNSFSERFFIKSIKL